MQFILKWDSFLCVDMCGHKALSTDKSFNVGKEKLKITDFSRKFGIFSYLILDQNWTK